MTTLVLLFALTSLAFAKKPNFLFIIADDQSPFDLKIYNPKSPLDTPNIDRLAKNGLVFDGSYHMGSWSGAVCTCSRTMIMTGQSIWKIPKKQKRNPSNKKNRTAQPTPQTLPAIFNQAGYETMRTCKRGNSYPLANKEFKIVKDATKRGGTDETGSHWHGQQVLDYLNGRESQKTEEPFLIYFGFSHPHDERNGKPELLSKYGAKNHRDKNSLPALDPKQPSLPINYLEKHPFSHGHPSLRDEVSVPGVWKNRDEATIRNELGREFACSENIDIQIGQVLKKLEAMGELDNTYIIYTSDHGMAIGRHGLQGKQNLYEHTWRVPYIVTGPGIKKGRVQGNIYLMDTLATLCDLAGIKAPATNEGTSFKPVLTGEKKTVRDTLFGVYAGGTKPGMRAVRQGDWKLVKFDVLDGTVRETQLFNLKKNPNEFLAEHGKKDPNLTDFAENPAHAKKLAEMEALLKGEMERLHDPYPLWNQK
ncbi:MAG: arylsulfatase A-like enzyme [Akkermansiaceae bacterium]|jgi:choline-sulfatase|tara:strand:+ start:2891 stop:4321 length:1431 start_codon:yes stop_codon:yes gene_type:complete